MRAVVIGVGSPVGDDAVGLAVARALGAGPPLPEGVRVLALERPGLDLIEALRGAELAVIVDAADAPETAGRVRRLGLPTLVQRCRAPSSHALGVAEALALGRALDALPPRVECVAVDVAPSRGARAHDPSGPLSPAVSAAVQPACREVRALLAECAIR